MLPIEIARIIADKRITVLYQPVYELATGKLLGYEALVRGPEGPLHSPLALFEAAARHHLLVELDTLCLSAAIREAPVEPGQFLFLNAYPATLIWLAACPHLLRRVEGRAVSSVLVLEVVESADGSHFLPGLEEAIRFFRSRGYRLALDDLSSGYNRLQFLRQLRPDFIKLDRPLIAGINGSADMLTALSLLVTMGHSLGAKVVAECVECEEELLAVRAAGADFAQGFHLGRPQPAGFFRKQKPKEVSAACL
ncbi:MAG: EAL domain-containing protein [Desulfotomaculales bacterium]